MEAAGTAPGTSTGRIVGWDDDDEGQEQMKMLMVPGALEQLAAEFGLA